MASRSGGAGRGGDSSWEEGSGFGGPRLPPPPKAGRPRLPCASSPSFDGSREAHQPQQGEPEARQRVRRG